MLQTVQQTTLEFEIKEMASKICKKSMESKKKELASKISKNSKEMAYIHKHMHLKDSVKKAMIKNIKLDNKKLNKSMNRSKKYTSSARRLRIKIKN